MLIKVRLVKSEEDGEGERRDRFVNLQRRHIDDGWFFSLQVGVAYNLHKERGDRNGSQ